MKSTTKAVLIPLLNSDSSISNIQLEGAVACLEDMPPPVLPELMAQKEVGHTLNISRQTVWAMVKKKQLTPIKLSSGLVRYRREDVMRIAKHGVEGGATVCTA